MDIQKKSEETPKVEIINDDLPETSQEQTQNTNILKENNSRKKIKWSRLIPAIVILALVVLYFVPLTSEGSFFSKTKNLITGAAVAETQNKVLVVIDGNIEILQSQVTEAYEAFPLDIRSNLDETTFLNEVIVPGEIIKLEAAKKGIEITKDDVFSALNDLILSEASDIEVSQSELTKDLNKIRNQVEEKTNFTLEEFLENQYTTLEDLKQNLELRLKLTKIFDIKITSDKVNPFFEKRQTSHILICFEGKQQCESELTQEEALEKINDLKSQLENGADFAELAKEYSTGPSSVNGGDLGLVVKRQMVQEFDEITFMLKEGEVSDVVETVFGYHLILVSKVIKEPEKNFPYTRDQIEELLITEEIQQKTQEFLDNLVASHNIEVIQQ